MYCAVPAVIEHSINVPPILFQLINSTDHHDLRLGVQHLYVFELWGFRHMYGIYLKGIPQLGNRELKYRILQLQIRGVLPCQFPIL